MLNQNVLMSGAKFFANDAKINPYYQAGEIDVKKAESEHQAIRQAFIDAGIKVIKVDPPPDSQDGVYTANWGLSRGNICVLSRLPSARRAEEAYAEEILVGLGKRIFRPPDGLLFSGQGDSLPCGGYLLAGCGYRSHQEAQAFAAEKLGLELVQLRAVPKLDVDGRPVINAASGLADSFFYDIDLAISVLREDLIAYCPEAFDQASQAKIEALPLTKIKVSYQEAVDGLACNLVSTGETVIMGAMSPEFRAAIESHGLKTITPKVSELAKGGGYIRCVSLTLD
jgi:N-dimethylarginine dimethylaminohydrolase